MTPNRRDDGHVSLGSLSPGDAGLVVSIEGEGAFRRRLLDMGFIDGACVRVIKTAPLQDPIEYCIGGTHVTLRKTEASRVLVNPLPPVPRCCGGGGRGRQGGGKQGGGRRRRGWPQWGRQRKD
ncbi:ferrous iron transport protein A [bacterium]|nr:ferrous iron transport protein A [bacterium]